MPATHVLVEAQIDGKVGDVHEVTRLPRPIVWIAPRKLAGAHDFGCDRDNENTMDAARNFFVAEREFGVRGYGRRPAAFAAKSA